MSDSVVGLQRKSNVKSPGGITGKGFRPGQSGNPSGKRKGTVSLNAALRRTLTRKNAETICRKLIKMAEGGDLAATKILFDRLDYDIGKRLDALERQARTNNTP